MLYTNAEIELLKLCAWCRDLPAGSTFLNKENLRALTASGQLRISRNGQSVRITESGKHTFDNLGLHFDYDSKSRGMGNYLIRRLNTANLMLFFFGGKTDVFCSSVPDRNSPLSFLPSFALRREKNKKEDRKENQKSRVKEIFYEQRKDFKGNGRGKRRGLRA